jgi:hypothetical protein
LAKRPSRNYKPVWDLNAEAIADFAEVCHLVADLIRPRFIDVPDRNYQRAGTRFLFFGDNFSNPALNRPEAFMQVHVFARRQLIHTLYHAKYADGNRRAISPNKGHSERRVPLAGIFEFRHDLKGFVIGA